MKDPSRPRLAGSQMIAAALAAWFLFLAIDFTLHAVIFAPWWQATEDYWLPPDQLFRLIPYAYASFAVYCVAMTWLLVRLYGQGRTLVAAARFGALAGLVFGLSVALANYSVFPMPASTLLVWPASYVIESTVGCGVASWVLDAERPWRRVGVACGVAVLLLVVAVVLQNLLFPTNS